MRGQAAWASPPFPGTGRMASYPMATTDTLPEADRLEGAPHPRETVMIHGHCAAEAEIVQAFNSGRLHHAWMLTGPKGIGKASLAWRIARFLLATTEDRGGMFATPPPATLDVAADHPVARRLLQLAEPRHFLLRRGPNEKETALSQVIAVDDVRKMKSFFALSAADGGRRTAIIDALDDMNTASTNALLKLLEEPPAKVTLLLIAHRPARLLPTIRSRCRELRLTPLLADDLARALAEAGGEVTPKDKTALTELSAGSVGEAFRLTNLDGIRLYQSLVGLMTTLPRLDRPKALQLADLGASKAVETFDLLLSLIDLFLARLARQGVTGTAAPEAAPGEAALMARLAPGPGAGRSWADLAQSLSARARRGKAVNLDPAALLMDTLLKIDDTAGSLAHR